MIPTCRECAGFELVELSDHWLCLMCGREFSEEDIPNNRTEVKEDANITE